MGGLCSSHIWCRWCMCYCLHQLRIYSLPPPPPHSNYLELCPHIQYMWTYILCREKKEQNKNYERLTVTGKAVINAEVHCSFRGWYLLIISLKPLFSVKNLNSYSYMTLFVDTEHIFICTYSTSQCCGSMTFWGRSGSADPCLWLMDPDPDSDPDPSIFVIDLQDASKKQIF